MGADLYPWIKLLHICCATISISGFTLRGWMRFSRPQLLKLRWIRITPHIVDSLLLACGIYLAINLQQYPGSSGWLTAKLAGLVLYIVLGIFVMRLAKTKRQRMLAFVAALFCFAYIVAVAVTRSAIPFA